MKVRDFKSYKEFKSFCSKNWSDKSIKSLWLNRFKENYEVV